MRFFGCLLHVKYVGIDYKVKAGTCCQMFCSNDVISQYLKRDELMIFGGTIELMLSCCADKCATEWAELAEYMKWED